MPVVAIVAIFAVVGILGFGGSGGINRKQVQQEVTALLDGVPQEGTTLGSPKAPVTLTVYGDLECPTVKLFVENHLPSLIEDWVRTGAVRLDYRSLETDTSDEKLFFEQEVAALAAARQDRMWNFLLTFARQQGEPRTDYVTESFMSDIASQVPGLGLAQWRDERNDGLLSKKVAHGVYSGHSHGLGYTPSFLIGFTQGKVDRLAGRFSIRKELETTLESVIGTLDEETSEDFPALKTVDLPKLGG